MTRNNGSDQANQASPRYELVIREQPQQCQVSSFDEKEKLLPMDPTPIVQLITYQDGQLIESDEHSQPPCILHVSLWSKNQTQPLDMVHINKKSSTSTSPILSTPVRTMVGTLSTVPSLLYDQQQHLGLYFSFPDIGVRAANTYCLKFDLIFLSDGGTRTSVAHIYSDPFVAYPPKNFPGTKESSDLTKHLVRQGLRVAGKSAQE